MKATCVQCHNEMGYHIDDETFKNLIFVCTNPKCSNYGLLAVCQEKMPKERNKGGE